MTTLHNIFLINNRCIIFINIFCSFILTLLILKLLLMYTLCLNCFCFMYFQMVLDYY